MNLELRKKASEHNLSLMDFILARIGQITKETGINRTIFAACPNSISVLRSALKSAKRHNAPIKFAATLNQVDTDGGYTGLTQKEFVKMIRIEAARINLQSPVIVAVDHGGPWLKDIQSKEKWSLDACMDWIKKSFEASIEAGYDLIHVDPTVDISVPKGQIIKIETVAERTLELIEHCELFRLKNGFPRIAYEVGTEEVHGGLADMKVFTNFLDLLKAGLKERNLEDVWPCFVVGKVGTDLHTSTFDASMARLLTETVKPYGSVIKGHYSDNVSNPQDYPLSGMGAANVGPEFTEKEYEALIELDSIEQKLFLEGRVAKRADLKSKLWTAVIESNRWKKWLSESENSNDFFANSKERQEWLVKTGCRYIWENPEVLAARAKLFQQLESNGIDANEILDSAIGKNMDKYFHQFNLVNLNDLL
jgi:tagatose-1,6-bisphosphate aldolase non-catalytic subunit AgaZ/GatZ